MMDAAALLLHGVLLFTSPDGLCVVAEGRADTTDVIVRVFYEDRTRLPPASLLLSRVVTFPVYDNVRSMGDCLPLSMDEVRNVEVRWVREVETKWARER